MMKRVSLFSMAMLATTAAWAAQPSQVISSPAPQPSTGNTNQSTPSGQATPSGLGNLSFTNSSGTVYTMDQLAVQLQKLRGSVEQTLPMLSAFTQTFSNAAPGGASSIAGAISSILSEALNRNSGQTQNVAGTSGQTTTRTNSLMAVLQGLMNTNATGSAALNPNTVQDLVTLQEDLQPVTSILQNLNVSTNLNQTTSPTTTTGNPKPHNGGLTPTGR